MITTSVQHRTAQFEHLEDLTEPRVLSTLLGEVASVARTPVGPLGHSGATHERVQAQLRNGRAVALFLKRTRVSDDWMALASGDGLGREVLMLQTPACNAVWDAFANPYLACAAEADQIGVLMDDLSDDIWADRSDLPVQPALSVLAEDAVLAALAQLHARYWEYEAAALPWLLRPATRFGLLGPRRSSSIRIPFEQQLTRGWQAALSAVPARVGRLLTTPPQSLARRYAVLPRTLVHGDTKVPNFALLPDGRVAAIDWALVGVGPSTLDLGWYLAINGGRLARSRDAVIARYRELLEAELRTSLSTELWTQMVGAGVLTGALVLLWEKALQLEAGSDPRVEAEWHWWVDALAGLC